MRFLFLLLLLPVAAFAQTAGYGEAGYIADPTLYSRFVSKAPDRLVALVPMLVAFMLGARALSEILLMFAHKTKNTIDNKIVTYLAKTVEILGKVLGQIGVGMPAKMAKEKVEKIEAKKK